MSIRLGTNLLSLGVQSRFNRADEVVTNTSQRLSSGLRINKGSDDAAGLAISSSLRARTHVFSQSLRNLNDGLSAINISEAALDGLTNILSRIEELSMQSVNGTNTDNQRAVMQQEVSALQSEWNRIVESTSFNGRQLLTGSGSQMVLQGGSGGEEAIAVQIGEEALVGGVDNAAGETTRMSTSSAGTEGGAASSSAVISADGRYVAFYSTASNLVAGDTNGVGDIFLKDISSGAITRVSTSSAGVQGDSHSFASVYGDPAISADGRYVAFNSYASNLVTGDTNGQQDVFMKDTLTGVTTRIATSSTGVQGNSDSYAPSISADGRYVAFRSAATNLVADDTNGVADIFVKDTLTGSITRISTSGGGVEGNGASYDPSISADGRYVAFESDASNLVVGDTNGFSDVFVKDIATGALTRVSTSSAGVQGTTGGSDPRISADGRYVAFRAVSSNLVTGDTNFTSDIFVKDTVTGVTSRVSTSSAGLQGNGSSGDAIAQSLSISADGRYVAFKSAATNLVTGDTNGQTDIFVKDTVTGTVTRVSTSSTGSEGNNTSTSVSLSADGRYVAFDSASSNLVSGDANAVGDVFLRDLSKAGVQTLAGMVVSDQGSAKVTMNLVEQYREELIQYRAKIGASTSRVMSMLSTIQSDQVSYAAATSRITDADVASESATLVAANTTRRVASALLAQANIIPEIALELLKRL